MCLRKNRVLDGQQSEHKRCRSNAQRANFAFSGMSRRRLSHCLRATTTVTVMSGGSLATSRGHAAIRINVGESQLFHTLLCCLHGVSAKAQLRSSFSEDGG